MICQCCSDFELSSNSETRFDVFTMIPTTFVWHQDLFFQTAEIDFSNRRVQLYFDDLLVPLDLERSHREILIGTFG